MPEQIATQENYLDVDVAYFVGLIMARGEFFEQDGTRRIVVAFPYRSESPSLPDGSQLRIEFETAYRLALDDLRNRIQALLGENVTAETSGNEVTLTVVFPQPTMSWRNIVALCGGKSSYRESEIPRVIFDSPETLKLEFVRGFADGAAIPSVADRDYQGRHRISIQVQHDNWILPVQLCALIQKGLQVPVQSIIWGHPNVRATSGGSGWRKEHRLRVYADSFRRIGFAFEWKQKVLEELCRDNERMGPARCPLCDPRTPRRDRKPPHDDESDPSLPDSVRGRHFDSFRGICRRLGCRQRHVPQSDLFEHVDDE